MMEYMRDRCNTPKGREASIAKTKIEEAVMWAVRGLDAMTAPKPKPKPDPEPEPDPPEPGPDDEPETFDQRLNDGDNLHERRSTSFASQVALIDRA